MADSGAPSFAALGGMLVDADGAVTYDFAGHVRADGIDIDAGVLSGVDPIPRNSEITWIKEDGAVIAEIWSYSDPADTARVSTWQVAHPTNGRASLSMAVAANPALRGMTVIAGSKTKKLIDDAGNSDFVQSVATPENYSARALDGGQSSVTITDGVSAYSAAVFHGLNRIPRSVQATAIVTGDTRDDYVVDVVQANSGWCQFGVRAAAAEQYLVANPTTVSFYWLAFG